jgi:1,2-diacylglycerol 3-alpha-glucosyltransferase
MARHFLTERCVVNSHASFLYGDFRQRGRSYTVMNIWMMTNTFTPFVGGVARSVAAFARECRRAGHRVVIVAPVFEGMPLQEGVIRVPALQDFNGSDFSLALPASGILAPHLEECRPDIVHSHHPRLLGNTAVRRARLTVFTHATGAYQAMPS